LFSLCLAMIGIQLLVVPARGVILFGSADPEYNTSAPEGLLSGSGWQYQGTWGGFLGTPVASQFFAAARHVGGSIGQVFEFNGVSYRTVAFYDDPETDLRLWKVDGVFPAWAPLYSGADEAGKTLAVFGRGTQRGDPILVACVQTNYSTNVVNLKEVGITRKEAQSEFPGATFRGSWMTVITVEVATNAYLRGWQSGQADGRMRWGTNQVSFANSFLIAAFDQNAGNSEAYLSSGDSSGGVFVKEDGVWKLAGINYGIQGPFSTCLEGPYFYGAVFDKTGLFEQGMSTPYGDIGQPNPINFYATRISPRLSWIMNIISQ
jgi:hypothetical protein